MPTELASLLVAEGHDVDVVNIAWDLPMDTPYGPVMTNDGVRVIIVPPRAITGMGQFVYRASKWLASPWFATRKIKRDIDPENYDVVVGWTPCATLGGALSHVLKNSSAKKVLYVYDFFPIHHMEIGLIPKGPIYRIAKAIEDAFTRKFDVIFCNLPGNMEYLRRNYPLRPEQDVRWTPLWTSIKPLPAADRDQIRRQYGLRTDTVIAVFGGQITEGRGIERMIEAAHRARSEGKAVDFVFAGAGRLAPLVQQAAAIEGSNIYYLPHVPRENFLQLVGACDLGLAVTVPEASSFSFPTKSMDYLRAGIPVVLSVEPGNDYAGIITDNKVGVSVPMGDDEAFYEAIIGLAADEPRRRAMAANTRPTLERVFDVRHGYRRLIDAVEGRPAS